MTKSEIGAFLTGKGFTETAHGHFVKGDKGKRVRYKMQATSVRIERESMLADYDGRPQSFWSRIGGGYYKDISLNDTGDKLRIGKSRR